MHEEKSGFNKLGLIISILFIFLYIFVFSGVLYPELSVQPLWRIPMDAYEIKNEYSIYSETVPDGLLSFHTPKYFGYFSKGGKLFLLGLNDSKAAVSDRAFVLKQPHEKESTHALYKPDGSPVQSFSADNAFFYGDLLFSAEAGGSGLASYDEYGHKLWSYRFPSQVSAFGAVSDLAVAGTVDGYLEGVGKDGKEAFAFSPGGSRLEIILGLGLSFSGKYIAVVSGIDKQRLVIMKKGGVDYKVSSHMYLDSDFREPVRVIVMEDDKHVLYRRNDGIGLMSIDGKVNKVLPVLADDFSESMDKKRNISYIMVKNGKQTRIAAFRLPSTLLGNINLPDSCDYAHIEGQRVYFVKDNYIAAFEFTEE